MNFEILIPIRSHLKKYLLHRFSENPTIIATRKTELGKLIIKCFSEKKTSSGINSYSERIKIKFTDDFDLTFSNGNVLDFNDLLEHIYRRELGMYIAIQKVFDEQANRKKSIYKFNEKFHISVEDIAPDTLIKHLQRHPKDMQLFENQ